MRKREFLSKKGETRPLKAKAFFGTHAGTETVHRTVSILRIAFFEPLFFTSKKEVSKMTLPFLSVGYEKDVFPFLQERVELSSDLHLQMIFSVMI